MSQKGNIMLTMLFTVSPEHRAEGDKLFESHEKWMETTHHKSGELELLSYNVAKGAEFTNPLDPSSLPTGNMVYTICEIYKTPEGLMDHWKRGQETWADFGNFVNWIGKGKLTLMHGSPIEFSLW